LVDVSFGTAWISARGAPALPTVVAPRSVLAPASISVDEKALTGEAQAAGLRYRVRRSGPADPN